MNRAQQLLAFRLLAFLVLGTLTPLPTSLHAQTAATAPTQPATAPSSVTWADEIAPILHTNCTICHHPGGAGPFSLLTYQDAKRHGQQIATVTQSRYMPPWLPEPGHGDFKDSRRLSQGDIATIARWVKDDMPSGDLSAAKPAPSYNPTWQYGTPDLVLTIERPYTLTASGTDVFLEFVLPYTLKQSHYIRAMEIRPGNPQVVHHANIAIDPTASFRHKHPNDWQNGVPGMELDDIDTGSSFDPPGHFLFWKPDSPVLVEPEGMPWKLDPGNDLVMNMHLKPSGKPEVISAQIGLYFTDKPPTYSPMLLELQHDGALDIPSGATDFPVEDSLRIPVDVHLLGIYPHAHYLGKQMEAWAMLPNQHKETLILIPHWDIDRQAVYYYNKPMLLPAGTVVHMRYTYDNSTQNVHNPHSPPTEVKSGNRSEDEMAHLWLQVLPVNTPKNGPDPRLLLEQSLMRSTLQKDPTNLIALYNIPAILDLQGKNKEVLVAYQQALKIYPDDERILNRYGVALEAAGDPVHARALFEQAIAKHPDACDARLNLGRLDFQGNQVNDAEQQFRQMERQCPPEAAVHSGLGIILEAEGNEETAKAELQQALQIDPHDLTALYALGSLAMRESQFPQAMDYLEAAATAHPEDSDTHALLAQAYVLNGRLNDAANTLRTGIRIAPSKAELHDLLSQVLARSGDLSQAITEEKNALTIEPDSSGGWTTLGTEEASVGHIAEARRAFNRAIQLDRSNAPARKYLQHLPPQ